MWWDKEETNVSFVVELCPLAQSHKLETSLGENKEETSPFENMVDFCGLCFVFLLSIEKSQPIAGFLWSFSQNFLQFLKKVYLFRERVCACAYAQMW